MCARKAVGALSLKRPYFIYAYDSKIIYITWLNLNFEVFSKPIAQAMSCRFAMVLAVQKNLILSLPYDFISFLKTITS